MPDGNFIAQIDLGETFFVDVVLLVQDTTNEHKWISAAFFDNFYVHLSHNSGDDFDSGDFRCNQSPEDLGPLGGVEIDCKRQGRYVTITADWGEGPF